MSNEEVIEWLRSPAGLTWSRDKHTSCIRHQHGVFAEEKWDIEHCTSVYGMGAMCPCNQRATYPDVYTVQIAGDISTDTLRSEDYEGYDIIDKGHQWLRNTYKDPSLLTGFGQSRRAHP